MSASSIAERRSGTLVLLRHGQSVANAAGLFTGVLDSPLSEQGVREARVSARLLRDHIERPDAVVTSTLSRATATGCTVSRAWTPPVICTRDSRLDERDYGALTGLAKAEVRTRYGEEWFFRWRRSVSIAPPGGESLADVIVRVRGLFDDRILPLLRSGGTVVVVAHGNSLRAACTVVDGLTEEQVQALNIPTGEPLVYRIRRDGRPVDPGGRYLDPRRALVAADELSREGGT